MQMFLSKRWILLPVLVVALCAMADDYVDDVYYLPGVAVADESSREAQELQPYYDLKNMEEIVFYDDVQPETGASEEVVIPAVPESAPEEAVDEPDGSATIEIHRK